MKFRRLTDEGFERICAQHQERSVTLGSAYALEEDMEALIMEVHILRSVVSRLDGNLRYIRNNVGSAVEYLHSRKVMRDY